MKLLQVDFDFTGPFGEEMAEKLAGLAESINNEPGFIWKIWTESRKDQLASIAVAAKTANCVSLMPARRCVSIATISLEPHKKMPPL